MGVPPPCPSSLMFPAPMAELSRAQNNLEKEGEPKKKEKGSDLFISILGND